MYSARSEIRVGSVTNCERSLLTAKIPAFRLAGLVHEWQAESVGSWTLKSLNMIISEQDIELDRCVIKKNFWFELV